MWLSHIKWRFWRKLGGFYVGGIENCDFSIGSWDGGWWKWCETPMKWLYPRKMVDFSSRKIDKNMKNCLKWVVRRAFRDLIFSLSMIFWDESYGVAIMGSNLVKKIVLKGSAGQKKFHFWGGRIQNRRPHICLKNLCSRSLCLRLFACESVIVESLFANLCLWILNKCS